MLGLGMTGKSCECGAQGEGCWVRSQGGLYIAMEPDRFTVVKGNKFASLAPKVGSVSEIHISHKETCYCGCRRVGFGSCARKNMQLCADQKCKATIKTEAQRQAALIYTVARLQSEDTLKLGATHTA